MATRIPGSLVTALRERFAHVSVTGDGKGLVLDGLDQAAIRALLNSLWDSGAEVRTLDVWR